MQPSFHARLTIEGCVYLLRYFHWKVLDTHLLSSCCKVFRLFSTFQKFWLNLLLVFAFSISLWNPVMSSALSPAIRSLRSSDGFFFLDGGTLLRQPYFSRSFSAQTLRMPQGKSSCRRSLLHHSSSHFGILAVVLIPSGALWTPLNRRFLYFIC